MNIIQRIAGLWRNKNTNSETEKAKELMLEYKRMMSAKNLHPRPARGGIELGNGVRIELLWVEGGTFMVLSEDRDAKNCENPLHQISVDSFWISISPVNQEQWQAIMGDNPFVFKDSQLPVENISWKDCQKFIKKLNEQVSGQGIVFRLPTEVEWEYADRCFSKSKEYMHAGSDTIGEVAWYGNNSGDILHPIEQMNSNELGLYEMSGNIDEWCVECKKEAPSRESGKNHPSAPGFRLLALAQSPTSNIKNKHPRSVDMVLGKKTILHKPLLIERKKIYQDYSLLEHFPIVKNTIIQNGVSLKLVWVEGGSFMMGSEELDAGSDEKPLHRVTVDNFWMGIYPVTQEQWQAIMGDSPFHFKGDPLPVENISWHDCQYFIQKLNEQVSGEGIIFRLPTEAEWEYAARGGKRSRKYKYAGSNTIGEVGWYAINSGDKTHRVGQKKPNELGLYDMSGNVWEWCFDWYDANYYADSSECNPTGPSTGSTHVRRGGLWRQNARYCRSACRSYYGPYSRANNLGFRMLAVPD